MFAAPRSIALFACAWLALVVGAFAQPAGEAYDFKGARLGATLAEVAALPFPDPVSGEFAPSGAPMTDADRARRFECGAPTNNGRAVSCTWRDGRGQSAPLSLGMTATFYFTEDSDGAMRLYEVLVGAPAQEFEIIEAALRERFGPARSRETGQAVTGLGMTVPQARVTWQNASSSIYVQSPSGSLDSMMIIYAHTRLGAVHAALDPQRNPM